MEPENPIHEEYRKARNKYSELIKSTKQGHWVEWLEEMDGERMWRVHKTVVEPSTDGGRTRIPPLREGENGAVRELVNNEEKSEALYRSFFPPPPTTTTEYDENDYPEPVCEFENITDEQIIRAIDKLRPYKGIMANDIANVVLKETKLLITPFLGPIYRATFNLRTYPKKWKVYDTMVTRKPGKPNYTIAKAYRPTCLLRTLGKLLSMATAENLNHIIEKHGILPKTHFGGRPGRSTTDAIHLLVKYVHDAWRTGKVVSALFLDVKGAYPSVDVNRLIHEMRKRGIPKEMTNWIREKLEGRETVICFDDYRSNPIGIKAGLDQGCALSGSLYSIYNAPLVEVPKAKRAMEEMAVAFVDDVALVAKGENFREANGRIEAMMNREGGALEWADGANCEFEIDKFVLMGFSKKLIPKPFEPRKRQPIPRLGITIRGHRLKPTQSTKYLGVIINQALSWAEQSAAALAAGTRWVTSCKRIAKPTQGIPLKLVKRLYLAACVPKMLYVVDVWGAPLSRRANAERKKKCGGQLGKLERVQRQALIMLGAMRTTATDILEAHANLLPFHLLIDKARHSALLCMATLPESNPINQHLTRARRIHVKQHKSPLHKLLTAYPDIKPEKIEKIQTIRRKPQWKPPFSIHVEESKEKAKEKAGDRREDIQIFTDGSGYEGGIGAAATSWRRGRSERTLQMHLGSNRQQIVYGGEVTGLILATELLRTETLPFDSVFIGIDNQAAIQATRRHRTAAGQYLVDIFRDSLDEVKRTKGDFDCQIHWTPGHSGIERNDYVDEKAKEAAQGQSSRKTNLPKTLRNTLPRSKAALKQMYATKLKERAAKHWKRSTRYPLMSKIDKSLPSNKFIKLTSKLSRNQTSLLLQLRTGHAPLNKHLNRIGSIDSPICPACNMEDETVHHFVITCPARNGMRRKTLSTLGRQARSLQTLLTAPKAIPYLLAYVKATGRFKKVFKLEDRRKDGGR